LQENTKPCFP